MKLATRKAAGFSLIEILVVLTVIGLLLSFVAPMVLDRPNQARQLKVANDLQAIKAALSLYYVDNGVLPTDGQGLQPLLRTENGFRYLEEISRMGVGMKDTRIEQLGQGALDSLTNDFQTISCRFFTIQINEFRPINPFHDQYILGT